MDRSGKINQDEIETSAIETSGEVQEASIALDATDPKSKDLLKLLKKHKVSMKNLGEGPNGFDEVELTGDRKSLIAVISDEDAGWGDSDLEEYIEESNGVFTVKVKSLNEDEAGLPAEELEDETTVVDSDVEAPVNVEADLELKGEGDAEGEEITEAEETEEVNAEESNPTVSEMLEKCYEMVKNEAKVWEEDAHDEHTVESYMKENAALVASMSARSLKEMKDESSLEAYEAACNEMIEAYTNKINEMKEVDAVEDAEDAAE